MHEAIDVSLSLSFELNSSYHFWSSGSQLLLCFVLLNFRGITFAIGYSAIGNLNPGCTELLAKLWKVVTNGKHNLCISNRDLTNLLLVASFKDFITLSTYFFHIIIKNMGTGCSTDINSIMKEIFLFVCIQATRSSQLQAIGGRVYQSLHR